MALLELSSVTMRFGGLKAVNDLSLAVAPGQLYGLIGPNGAGKTTVFNLLTGVYTPTGGRDPSRRRSDRREAHPDAITRLGIARTFQNIRLFGDLTVLDNVRSRCHCRQQATALRGGLPHAGTHATEEARVDRAAASC